MTTGAAIRYGKLSLSVKDVDGRDNKPGHDGQQFG
jgi:hypothetical protein